MIFCLGMSSCHRNECIQKSKLKHKKYRIKKLKPYQRGVGGGTATTADYKKEQEVKAEKPKPPEKKTAQAPDEVLSIPDSKVGGPPIKKEKKIEFQGQEIDLADDEFVYEEQISFVNATDLFSDPSMAREQVKELAKLLKSNDAIKLTIVGNTATTLPVDDTLYGDSPEVLSQVITLNTRDATIKDTMLARAKRVYNLLIESGVDPSQLDYRTGSHRRYKRERVVTFIIR